MSRPMRGGRNMPPVGTPPKNAKKTFKRLISYIGKYRFLMIPVAICVLVSAVAGVAGSLFMKTLIDDYISPMLLEGNTDFSGLLSAITTMACVFAAGIIANFVQSRLMIRIAQGILKKVRDDMFSHMQTLPVRYFDQNPAGDTMSLYTNDTDTLRQMITQSIPQFLSSAVTIIAVFISMITTSVWMTLFVLAFVAVMFVVTARIGSKSGRYFAEQQKTLGDVNGYVEEMIHGQKVVKVFCREDETAEEFDRRNEILFEQSSKAHTYVNILGPVNNNLGHLQYALLGVFGGALAIFGVGGVTLGAVAAFLQLSKSFTQPIGQIAQQASSIVMALAGAERIFRLLDEEPETDEGYVTLVNAKENADGTLTECTERTGVWAWKHPHSDGSITYTRLAGDVRLTEVDFAYVPEKTVLHDITLFAEPGQKIAFVGTTGAGKTTITNLINRFYDIADGKVRYDGININKIRKSDLRRSLGVVLQDVNLFTGTVMENIRYGRLDATDEECIAAAKRAGAHDFIELLADGYDTVLSGDGAGLSQGQRQLLSIARAAVADPPVMILDEATSSIDTRTERIVQAGMDALMQGRTVFVIAHRLSTIQNSDVIMVLDHGRIIERGSHEELMELGGRYHQLYTGSLAQ